MFKALANLPEERKKVGRLQYALGLFGSPLLFLLVLATGKSKGGYPFNSDPFMLWSMFGGCLIQCLVMAGCLWAIGSPRRALAGMGWMLVVVGGYVSLHLP